MFTLSIIIRSFNYRPNSGRPAPRSLRIPGGLWREKSSGADPAIVARYAISRKCEANVRAGLACRLKLIEARTLVFSPVLLSSLDAHINR